MFNQKLAVTSKSIASPENQKQNRPVQYKGYEAKIKYPLESSASKPGTTGLPATLKAGIESMSGYSMDDVQVHYNSSKPSEMNALAYAQGTDIHIAKGQERHLPHEAWHVVQQKQGRVKPTMQMKGSVKINDDRGLEKEADLMGTKARSLGQGIINEGPHTRKETTVATSQLKTAQRNVVQRVVVAGINVQNEGQMPTWEQNNKKYHINLTTATFHVTEEGIPKIHFYYEGAGQEIRDKQPTKAERGGSATKKKEGKGVKTKRVFSDLPQDVQNFIRTNYLSILRA